MLAVLQPLGHGVKRLRQEEATHASKAHRKADPIAVRCVCAYTQLAQMVWMSPLASVRELRAQAAAAHDLPAYQVRLFAELPLRLQLLSDEQSLIGVGLVHGAVLHVMPRSEK